MFKKEAENPNIANLKLEPHQRRLSAFSNSPDRRTIQTIQPQLNSEHKRHFSIALSNSPSRKTIESKSSTKMSEWSQRRVTMLAGEGIG